MITYWKFNVNTNFEVLMHILLIANIFSNCKLNNSFNQNKTHIDKTLCTYLLLYNRVYNAHY